MLLLILIAFKIWNFTLTNQDLTHLYLFSYFRSFTFECFLKIKNNIMTCGNGEN